MSEREKRDGRASLRPPSTETIGRKRPRRAEAADTAPLPWEDEADLVATLAARLISAEQARKRAEEREREARAKADAIDERAPERSAAPALVSDLARRLADVSLRIQSREALLERDLADVRELRATVAELSELAWRLAGPSTALGIPALALTDPPAPARGTRSRGTLPAVRRPR